jgi:hypothetical protein
MKVRMQFGNAPITGKAGELAKAMPEIDLSTITREEINSLDLPCINIKRAVEAGLLEAVKDYTRLDHQI